MGHAGCGAVTAAVDGMLKKVKEPERIETLLELIEPGLAGLDLKQAAPARLAAAVEANVRWSVRQLAGLPGVGPVLKAGRIKLVGAVYELDSGKVRFLA
jgi:carbonic anhydrase